MKKYYLETNIALETQKMFVIVDDSMGFLHMSISLSHRNPTWEEISKAREKFLLNDKTFIHTLPEKKDYVNIHKHCFHIFERCQKWFDTFEKNK